MAEEYPRNVRSASTVLAGRYRNTGFSQWQPYSQNFVSRSTSYGGGHAGWRNLGDGDTGGPWFLDKVQYTILPIVRRIALTEGPMWIPTVDGWSATADLANTVQDAKAFGTKAIAATTPNNPTFSLSQAIGELRADGLPHIVGSDILKERARYLKGSGSEYLNVEFGWKPLVRDLHNFARTVKQSHEIIKGYQAHSDQKIRRRHVFPPDTRTISVKGNGVMRPNLTISYTGECSTTEIKRTRSWFSGAFRYHVPVGDNLASKLAQYESYANKLLGTRLTPDSVWNLTPWSWAADWFSNTGDIMKNISNLGNDGMVMQYGYMMREMSKETSTAFKFDGGYGYFREEKISKRRLPASPYSFDTTFDGLSNRQKAICAAIGITRVR